MGLLRQDDDPEQSRQPTPGFEQLDDILEVFRGAGLDVRLARIGPERPPTGTADVAAYRIVQEALTNAGKHGTTPHAELSLVYSSTELRITVRSPAHPSRQGPGTGHGLVGMRERAEAAGGTLDAGFRPDGTFTVEAVLPLPPNPD